MKNGKYDDGFWTNDVEDPVRESPHECAANIAMSHSIHLRRTPGLLDNRINAK